MESFHRINWSNWNKNKTFFCVDEANQIMKQITSETFMQQQHAKESWETFKQCVRYSQQIILMDAHLTPDTIMWFQKIKGDNAHTSLFINEYLKPIDSEILLAASAMDVLVEAESKLNANKKIFIACNSSIDKIDVYSAILSAGGKKVLTIHRDTLSLGRVKHAIEHVETWGDYDAIITSPSIQSGLSYDIPDVFDSVYGIFGNYSSASTDCIQMLARIRNPINKRILTSISMKNNNHGQCTKEIFYII